MIPNKSNFKFQELTPITGVKPYVIRFWETEFPEISPISSEGGQKIYSRSDVESILKIKKLLFDEKLSIPEAKAKMMAGSSEQNDEYVANPKALSTSVGIRPLIINTLKFIKEIKAKRNW